MDFMSARNLIDKRMLDIASGSFVGHVVAVLIDEKELMLKAFAIRHDDDSIYYVNADLVEHLTGEYLTVKRLEEHEDIFGRNILEMPVITVKGEFVGEVEDFLLDEEKRVKAVILSGDFIKESAKSEYGEVAAENLTMIGKEVILSDNERKDIHVDKAKNIKKQPKTAADDVEDVIESVSHKAKESVSGLADKVKEIDREQINRDFNRFAGSVNKEMGKLLDSLSERLGKKTKTAQEDDIRAIMHDLGGYTVSEVLIDREGDAILMPGQTVDEATVEKVLKNDLVTVLYRIAVPVAQPDIEEMQAEEVSKSKEDKHEENHETL